MMSLRLIVILLGISLFSSCRTSRSPVKLGNNLELSTIDSLKYLLDKFEDDTNHFLGFVLYDPVKSKAIIEYNADQPFIPASNVKLLTLLATTRILKDSMPALAYKVSTDSLIIRGTGNPALLTKNDIDSTVIKFLRTIDLPLYFDDSNFNTDLFGSGWAWDDYQFSYQKEKSALPIYGNATQVLINGVDSTIRYHPNFNSSFVYIDKSLERFVKREQMSNQIYLNPLKKPNDSMVIEIPLRIDDAIVPSLLSTTIEKPVKYFEGKEMVADSFISLYQFNADSLYKDMMLDSDNFVAEQLLLMCSHEIFGELNTRRLINYLLSNDFSDIKTKVRWADGSGLSRYNLMTPNAAIWVLEQLSSELTKEDIKQWFPSNDQKGTLPESLSLLKIYGKTGTLSNNFNLSGYIETVSGKTYLFSYMNNHYLAPKSQIANGMKGILNFVHQNL